MGCLKLIDEECLSPLKVVHRSNSLKHNNFKEQTTKSQDIPGYLQFDLKDHLGNVRVSFENRRNSQGQPVITAYNDYYAFGGIMPGRSLNPPGTEGHTFGYQGQENDQETGLYAFDLRMFEPELGRWFTPDPYEQHWSPYVGMGNNPISRVDPDGGFDQCPEEGDSQDCEDGNSETYINGRWIQDAIVQTEKNDYAIISVFENENKLSKWERFKEWFSNLFSKEKSTRKEKTTYTFGLVLRASKGGKDQPDLPEAKYTWTIEDFDVLTDVLGVLQMNDRVFEFKKINKTTKPFILKLSKKEFSKLMSGKIISSSKREYYSKITNQYKLHKSDIKKANYSSYSENSKLIKSKEDFFDEVGRTLGENAFSQAGNSLYNDYQLEISQDKYDTIQFKNGVIDIQGTPGNIDVIYKNGIPIDTDYWTPSPK